MSYTSRTQKPTTPNTEPSSALNPSPGARIGRYVVRRAVGRGGMGVVVAAHDPELDREVAIKLVATERGESRTRLVREAQALAKLSDPNVVTVYEVIWIGDRAGIVMALVDGQDLGAWRETGEHSWREIVSVYVQAARGLAAAHRAGLVHRDFKPSNAVIGKDGVVRVTDFGLVRTTNVSDGGDALGAEGAFDVALTRTGVLLGTPAYMAPEQHQRATIDARTDQWALGCSLYEALYGYRPFEGGELAQLRENVVAGNIRPEPEATRVPKAVRAIVRRTLSANPADRFASMDELIAALEKSGRRRGRIVAGIAAAVIFVSVGGLAMWSRHAPSCAGLDAPLRERWNPAKAKTLRAQLIEAGRQATMADRILAALDDYGGRWSAARTRACTQSGPELDRRMRCLDQRLVEFGAVVDGITTAQADAVDHLHLISDCDDPRESVPRPADRKARLEIDRAENDLARAWASYELNQYERAQSLAQEAAGVGNKTGWAPLEARATVLLGDCQDRQRDYSAALATLERAADLGAIAKDDAVVAEALVQRFLVLDEHLGRFTDALAGRSFVELALVRAGQPPRLRAEWLHYLSIALFEKDQNDEALAAVNESLQMWQKQVRADNVRLIDALETKANILTNQGKFTEAEPLHREVLAARIAARGPNDPSVADAEGNIAALAFRRNEMDVAIEHWTRAARINDATGKLNWRILVNLGQAHAEVGQLRAAAADFTAARKTAEREAPGKSLWLGECDTGLGSILFGLGQLDRARPLIESGLAAARASKGPFVVISLFWSVKHALLRKDLAAASADLDELVKADDDPKDPMRFILQAELARAKTGCRGARKAIDAALAAVASDPWRSERLEAAVLAAECDVEMGEPKRAITELEPELSWLEAHHPDAEAAAAARFAMAQALSASGGDRERARSLATQARSGLFGAARAAATRWLEQNR